MSMLTIVEFGKSYKFLTMHYSELSDFLRGAKKVVDAEISSDGIVIVDRASKTVISSQNIVGIPNDWRVVIV